MNTLGVDTGIATCGWAVVDPSTRLVDFGVLIAPKGNDDAQRDRIVRARLQSEQLFSVIAERNVDLIVGEGLSFGFGPRPNAIAGVCLSWGVLVGLATATNCDLLDLPPKVWQHRVQAHDGKVDYDAVAAEVEGYIRGQGLGTKLETIIPSNRNHAFDAVAIATYAAVYHRRERDA